MLSVLLMQTALGLAQAKDPLANMSPVDIEHGQRLFRHNCAVCHGFDGTGGTGPSLARAKFHRAADNQELIELITEGLPDRGMPPSWHLLPNGPKLVAAYVRTLGHVVETPVPGNIEHGRTLFRSAGCVGCHIASGEGAALGPELTDIGLRRTAAVLRKTVLQPETTIPQGFMMLRVQTKDGPELVGTSVNEDSFTVQLKDQGGHFHSFEKAKLVQLERVPGKTFMPGYASSLPAADLDDLVAYLTSLRGAQ
jgi:cytochrome c oxidase cbb3-type subunit III